MPLIFSSAVQAAFFTIFFVLFVAVSITALIFLRKTTAGLPVASFFLSLTLVCLVPKYPLIYCACLLISLSLVGQVFQKYPLKLTFALLGALGQGLYFTQVMIFLSLPFPYWMIPLPACLFFGAERALCALKKRELAIRIASLVIYLEGIILSVILLVEGEFYYAAFLILIGYLYLFGGTAVPEREEDRVLGRNFFKATFLLLGLLLIFLGLALYVAA